MKDKHIDPTQQKELDAQLARQIEIVRNAPDGTVFQTLWRNKFLCTDAESFDEFRDGLAEAVATLDRWKQLGVKLDTDSGIEDDYAVFTTESKEVALAEGFWVPEGNDGDAEIFTDDSVLSVGSGICYTMTPRAVPPSPEALVADMVKFEEEMPADASDEEGFDASELNAKSDLTVLDVRFSPYILPPEKRIKRIGDGYHNLTYAEILWQLHRAVDNGELGDHTCFEGLTFDSMGEDGVPLFDALMGS